MNIVKVTPIEAMTLGKTFAESGLFPDIKAAGQAVVKIMAGQEMGIGPFQAMNGIHIIQGKATVGAGIIAAMVKGSSKYDYRVTEQNDKVCSIDYYQADVKIGTSKFTIEDAKKAGTKNLDKYPANMLFARAMSNGCKWYTPDVFNFPVYVPEEIESVNVEDAESEVINPEIETAIKVIEKITTVEELKEFKVMFKSVIKEPSIIKLLTDKYNEIK